MKTEEGSHTKTKTQRVKLTYKDPLYPSSIISGAWYYQVQLCCFKEYLIWRKKCKKNSLLQSSKPGTAANLEVMGRKDIFYSGSLLNLPEYRYVVYNFLSFFFVQNFQGLANNLRNFSRAIILRHSLLRSFLAFSNISFYNFAEKTQTNTDGRW